MNIITEALRRMLAESESRKQQLQAWSQIIGYEICSEAEYEKAKMGAPMDMVKNPKISPLACSLVNFGSEGIDAKNLAEELTRRFASNNLSTFPQGGSKGQ